jgi:DNA-binding NtrC family response regulator
MNLHSNIVRTFREDFAPLSEIIPDPGDTSDDLVRSIGLLLRYMDGKESAVTAFSSARQVDIQGKNSDICILFLAIWTRASLIQSPVVKERVPEAWSLLRNAQSLISDETPREIKAFIIATEALCLRSQGRIAEQDQKIHEAIGSLDAKSPRRWATILLDLAPLLADSGRLSEISTEIDRLEANTAFRNVLPQIALVRFVNAVETCQIQNALQIMPRLPETGAQILPARNFRQYASLLNILQEIAEGERQTGMSSDQAQQELPDWALVLRCLAGQSLPQALSWARVHEKKNEFNMLSNSFISFNLLRTELANRNSIAARRLLELRTSRGNIHYLDPFFHSRIELLEGKEENAARMLAAALQACIEHDARPRLEMELHLSAEMPRGFPLRLVPSPVRTPKTVVSIASPARPAPSNKLPAETLAPCLKRIIGSSPSMQSVRRTITRFASLDVPILVCGETGTGKELVSRALHDESARAQYPFMAVNCGAISESLLESELFGHEKGAFTGASASHAGLFEEAAKGTLLLDEIGDISPRIQVALLRVLETGEIRRVGSAKPRQIQCRLLAATNNDLSVMAESGKFRADLLFRLRRLEIIIPPLRNRKEDILPLANHFLNDSRAPEIQAMMSEDLCRLLIKYPWPGNVRELRNAIERMRLMNSDKLHYTAADLELPQLTGINSAQIHTDTSTSPMFSANSDYAAQGSIHNDCLNKGRSAIRRIELLRDLFRQHRSMTRDEIIRTLRISPNTATRDLQELVRRKYIERIEPSASPRSVYFKLREFI